MKTELDMSFIWHGKTHQWDGLTSNRWHEYIGAWRHFLIIRYRYHRAKHDDKKSSLSPNLKWHSLTIYSLLLKALRRHNFLNQRWGILSSRTMTIASGVSKSLEGKDRATHINPRKWSRPRKYDSSAEKLEDRESKFSLANRLEEQCGL